jgi:hypothetical protein
MNKRFQAFWAYLFAPLWKLLLSGPPFFYGWFAFVRDEFLPSDMADKLRIGGIFSSIDWYYWVIGGLAIWLFVTTWEATKKRDDIVSLSGARQNIEGLRKSLKKRVVFLDKINTSDVDTLQNSAEDLVRFIENLPNGKYYATQIKELTTSNIGFCFSLDDKGLTRFQEQTKNANINYKKKLRASRKRVLAVIDEFLQTQ